MNHHRKYSNHNLNHKMGHLACYTGGLFALSSMYVENEYSLEIKQLADLLTPI